MTLAGSPERYRRIAHEYGTPVHVLSLDLLDERIDGLRNSLLRAKYKWGVYYSVKTNYLPVIVRRMIDAGFGMDIVSGYELELVRQLKVPGDRTVFNGPMKLPPELDVAIKMGSVITLDSPSELSLVKTVRENRDVNVGVRVRTAFPVYGSDDPSYLLSAQRAASNSKFGMSPSEALSLANGVLASDGISLTMVQTHLGSQIADTRRFVEALAPAVDVFAELKATGVAPDLKVLNIGGGMGVAGIARKRGGPLAGILSYFGSDVLDTFERSTFSMEKMIDEVEELLHSRALNPRDVELRVEPGRFLVSEPMVLLTKVYSRKSGNPGPWLILDAGLHLLPTAGPAERHSITNLSQTGSSPEAVFQIGGPLCYEGDVLSYETILPDSTAPGDVLAIHDSGAYSVSRSTNFIRERAPVVACESEDQFLCWRREEFEDIFAFAPTDMAGS